MQVIIRSRRTRARSRSKQARAATTSEIVQLIYTISSGRTCIGPSDVTQDAQESILLYHQHASLKDKRHPQVDENLPGRGECTSLTRHVCKGHAVQVRSEVACRDCYS
jgi:hypothetical protein